MCWQGRMHACWGPSNRTLSPGWVHYMQDATHHLWDVSCTTHSVDELACRRFLKRQVCASCLQAAAWQHFLNSGIHEGRPHRFTC